MRHSFDTPPRPARYWLALATLLAGCQVPPAHPQTAADPDLAAAGPPAAPVSDCASDRTARLTTGLVVKYAGADHANPATCLVTWNGRPHRYVLGVIPKARGQRISPQEPQAIRTALQGPVGTKAEFEDEQAALWGRVTVEHVGDPVILLGGKPRRTVQLRIVRHDARGRPEVRSVTLYWIDVRTGIALRQQVVTEMDDGRSVADDVWRVESLG